jgi:hypothetical protein
LHKKIKPFAVYFPQFHVIPENNKIYVGMTDIVNLKHYITQYKKPNELIDTPSLNDLSLSDVLDYTLTNKEIITKQIEIAKTFSIYGFACYYYWFSENSITNKHTIYENCYDLFFQESDFKIYFIWSNEDWKNNSCNDTPDKIINVYHFDNFMKNINHLIKYFKHSNYYKIDNKPVFFVHQPNYISSEHLSIFNYMLETECIKHGFDGISLHLNNSMNINSKYNMYNWPSTFNGYESIDYYKYTNTIVKSQIKNKNIQTLFFDFNNSSKFCIPYKPNSAIKYTNTSIYNQNYLIDTILTTYKQNKKKTDILLINSWNNWGENTAIEPGEINKKKYLSLFKSNLLSFIP